MKRIIFYLLQILPILSYSQDFKMIRSSIDTTATAISTPTGYGNIYYNKLRSQWWIVEGGVKKRILSGSSSLSGLTTNRIPYATSSTTIGDDSALTWDAGTNTLTTGMLVAGQTAAGNILGVTYHSDNSPFGVGTNIHQGVNHIWIGTTSSKDVTLLTNSTERLKISSAGAFGLSGANYGTSGQVLTSAGSGSAPTWTTQSSGITVGTTAIASGANTLIPYNDSGFYGEDSALGWNETTNTLNVENVNINLNDASTNSSPSALILKHNSTVTPVVGFGMKIDHVLENGSSVDVTAARDYVAWQSATSGAETSERIYDVMSEGTRSEVFRQSLLLGNKLYTLNPYNTQVTSTLKLSKSTTGSPTNGYGTGLEFEVETTAGLESGMEVNAVVADVGSGTEDFDLVVKLMKNGATAAEQLKVTSDGRLSTWGLHIPNYAGTPDVEGAVRQYIASGTYTPTLTNGVNIAAKTAYLCMWTRVGNVVTVSGLVDIDPTAGAGTFTTLLVSLPIASALTQVYHLAGTCHSDTIDQGGNVYANTATDEATLRYVANDAGNVNLGFTFQYTIF